jgi:hypothetical protein
MGDDLCSLISQLKQEMKETYGRRRKKKLKA